MEATSLDDSSIAKVSIMKTKKKSLFAWFGRTVAVSLVPMMLVACANNSSDNDDQKIINQNPPSFSTDPSADDRITGTSYIKVNFDETVSGVKAGDSVVLKDGSGIEKAMTLHAQDGKTFTFDPTGALTSGIYYLYVGYGGDITDSDGSIALPGTVVFYVDDAKQTVLDKVGGLTAADAAAIENAVTTAIASVDNDLLTVIPAAIEAALGAYSSSTEADIVNTIMSAAKGAASLTSTADREISARVSDMANFAILLDRISAKLIALGEGTSPTLDATQFQAAIDAVQNSFSYAGAQDEQPASLLDSFNSSVITDVSESTTLSTAHITAADVETDGSVASATVVTLTTAADTPDMSSKAEEIKGVFGAASSNTYSAGDYLDAEGGTDTMTLTAAGTAKSGAVFVDNVEIINIQDTVGSTFNTLLIEDTPAITFKSTVDGKTSTIEEGRIGATYGLAGKGNLTVYYSAAEVTGESTTKLTLDSVGTSANNVSAVDLSDNSTNTVENVEIVASGTNYLTLDVGSGADNITLTGAGANTFTSMTTATNLLLDASASTGANKFVFGANLNNADDLRGGTSTDELEVSLTTAIQVLATTSGIETIDVNYSAAGILNMTNMTGVTAMEISQDDNASVTNAPSTITSIKLDEATSGRDGNAVSFTYASGSTNDVTVSIGATDSTATNVATDIGAVTIAGSSGAVTVSSIGEADNEVDNMTISNATKVNIQATSKGLSFTAASNGGTTDYSLYMAKATDITLDAAADDITFTDNVTAAVDVTSLTLKANGTASSTDSNVLNVDNFTGLHSIASISIIGTAGGDVTVDKGLEFKGTNSSGTSVTTTMTVSAETGSVITVPAITTKNNSADISISSLTISGDGDVTIATTELTADENVSVVDASGHTGSLTFNVTGVANNAATAGSTADNAMTITLGNAASGDVNAVSGGSAADQITGGTGTDVIYGLGGADVINPGLGADHVIGGAGQDQITLTETTASSDNLSYSEAGTANVDQVTGFNIGTVDDIITVNAGNDAMGNLTLTDARGNDLGVVAIAGFDNLTTNSYDNISASTSATPPLSVGNVWFIDNTTATATTATFAQAVGSASVGNSQTGGGHGLLTVWYDALNGQAVYGMVQSDNSSGNQILDSSDNFTEIVRVTMSASDFTWTNIDQSLAAD